MFGSRAGQSDTSFPHAADPGLSTRSMRSTLQALHIRNPSVLRDVLLKRLNDDARSQGIADWIAGPTPATCTYLSRARTLIPWSIMHRRTGRCH